MSASRFVLDASAAITALTGKNPDPALRRRLLGGHAAAPELFDLEVLSTLRKQLRAGVLPAVLAERLSRRLHLLPVDRPLIRRVRELRHTITPYDAAYVALAEQLDVPLVTTDAKLARSHGHKADIELYAA